MTTRRVLAAILVTGAVATGSAQTGTDDLVLLITYLNK